MSDQRDNSDSDQEMPELSDDDPLDEETEDEEFPPVIENPAGAMGPQFHSDGGFCGGSSGFVESPVGGGSSEPVTPGDEMPAMQGNSEVPVPVDRIESNADGEGDLDVEAGKESKPKIMELENGSRLLAIEAAKAARSEDDLLPEAGVKQEDGSNQSHPSSPNFLEGDDSGSEEEQCAFMRELERFHRVRSLDFKPPKFYGEGLNCLKLWRAVARLGGYDRVTTCKLWRQVGESFRPPKTCTTVSWTFRIFYEKALLEYEKHKIHTGELQVPIPSLAESMSEKKMSGNQASGSGRARRDAAARAMKGWHSQRYLGNGEVGDPIIKDKNSKHLKSIGSLKRKKSSSLEHAAKLARTKSVKSHGDSMVIDIGEPADWVKINVRRTKDCFEIYALVPGLLREEVHVQSDPCGRLIISGDPEQLDNPWGVTSFKKVITLPSRIDPHQTSAVVTLHGQLFVRAPFEQLDL